MFLGSISTWPPIPALAVPPHVSLSAEESSMKPPAPLPAGLALPSAYRAECRFYHKITVPPSAVPSSLPPAPLPEVAGRPPSALMTLPKEIARVSALGSPSPPAPPPPTGGGGGVAPPPLGGGGG